MIKFHIYEGGREGNRQWYWRARRNGRTVADGGEGYYNKANAKRAVQRFIKGVQTDECRIEIDG